MNFMMQTDNKIVGEGNSMKEDNIRIGFLFAAVLLSFKQQDLDILKKHFDVRTLKYEVVKYKDYLGVLLKLLKAVFWADVTFSWFAGEHALWAVRLSKLLRKKAIAGASRYFIGFVQDENLLMYYQRAKVYDVQVSAHEAFGMSLAESMLCECILVVTDRVALPEVVGSIIRTN